jgi:hypothetical protein
MKQFKFETFLLIHPPKVWSWSRIALRLHQNDAAQALQHCCESPEKFRHVAGVCTLSTGFEPKGSKV